MPQPAVRRPTRPESQPRQAPARRPVRPAPRHRPRLRKRRLMRIAGALSLAVMTTSGLGNVAMGGLGAGIGRVDAFGGLDNRPPRSAGENFLLVGTDGRDHVTPEDRRAYRLGGVPCHCSDTIILVHLSQDRSRLSAVSIPRDSYTRLPAVDGRPAGPGKLNAAYSLGGPRLTVRTVERMTGVHIDHYLEVDFVSFMRTIDALGGVPVCSSLPLHDAKSGLDLPAGRTLLDGGQSLEYVRARYVDGSADLGRMRRQQRFLAGLIQRAASSDVLLNPVKLQRTIGTALDSVRADPQLGSADLLRLAEALRQLTPADSEFTSVPFDPVNRRVPGAGDAVAWDAPRAARLFAAIRADRPIAAPHPARSAAHPSTATPVAIDPSVVRVLVTGADKETVWRTATALHATGFLIQPPSAARGRAHRVRRGAGAGARTVISYDPRWNRSVRSLAAAIPSATLRAVPRLGRVLRVALGRGGAPVAPVRFASTAGTVDPGPGDGPVSGSAELCS